MREKIKELYKLIRLYDSNYYGEGRSLISDKEYDDLYRELCELEKKYPQFADAHSPTQRVGDDLSKEFTKIQHTVPMMSIDNTYSHKDLKEWMVRTKKLLESDTLQCIGELKIDGVACAVRYERGTITRAITRGNGLIGDDITGNVSAISSLPSHIDYMDPFEIRGEIYLTYKNFNDLNARLIENGQNPMQNPRNTASGTIKLLNRQEVAQRKLHFSAHYLLSNRHKDQHIHNLSFLERIGIPTVIHSPLLHTSQDIIEYCDSWKDKRHDLPFPSDGVVIKTNNINQQELLGNTAKSPRWLIAYKYKPETAITEICAIDPQVGRTGVITPVARLKPVALSGSMIKNATLHNYNEIKRLGITIGDRVEIEKSGEIIPKILKVVEKGNSMLSSEFKPPETCPSCYSKTVQIQGEVALRCINASCPAQIFASMSHFVSREAMNIEGLGPSLLQQLIHKKLIKTPVDIFSLSCETLANLDRMGIKSATNLVNGIQRAKDNPLHVLIHALGIKMVGAQTAKILTQAIEKLSDLKYITYEQLVELDSIGPSMAHSITSYFKQEKNIELLEQLERIGVNCIGEKTNNAKPMAPLQGKKIVLTGTLEAFTRIKIQSEIEKLGGTVTSSVSSKTSFLIYGKEPGSKLAKAKNLDIITLNENEFLKMLDSFSMV